MATPRITLYQTELTWQNNSVDALVPSLRPIDGIYISWTTLLFFLLSAASHGFVALTNPPWANEQDDELYWTGWYYLQLDECRAPHRWVEYALSAPVMATTIAATTGVTEVYNIVFIFVLLFTVMTYGFIAEILAKPAFTQSSAPSPGQWKTKSFATGPSPGRRQAKSFVVVESRKWHDTTGAGTFLRLMPHLIGYVPCARSIRTHTVGAFGLCLDDFYSRCCAGTQRSGVAYYTRL